MGKIPPYSAKLTADDCRKFKAENPAMMRHDVRFKKPAYFKAMVRLGLLDELYPKRNANRELHSDEELIATARKYETVRDMKEHDPLALRSIYIRNLKDVALAHMKPIGDRRKRMIYAFEFEDKHAYIGLTYDAEQRRRNHMKANSNSAVRRYAKATGLTPTWKALTDYVPVEEARRLEGEFVKKYREAGWKILNVNATGGIGGTPMMTNSKEILTLAEQGLSVREIAERIGRPISTVGHFLTSMDIKLEHPNSRPVEMLDDEGNVVKEFPSVMAAANHLGVHQANLRKNIKRGYKTHGCLIRYKES